MIEPIPDFVERWVKRAVNFDNGFRIVYISIVTILTIILTYATHRFIEDELYVLIPYGFYFLMFFIWSYRIAFSNLVRETDSEVKHKDITVVFFSSLLSLLVLTFLFGGEEISFKMVLIAIAGFSLITFILFFILNLLAVQNSLIYKYFLSIFVACLLSYVLGSLTRT